MRRWWRVLSLRRRRRTVGGCRGVPSGYLAMYVGPERRRFIVPTRYLNLPVFASLLERVAEEYGYQPAGGLAIPCVDVAFFRWIVDMLEQDERRLNGLGLDALIEIFSDLGGGCFHRLEAVDGKPSCCFRLRRASSINSGYYRLVKG